MNNKEIIGNSENNIENIGSEYNEQYEQCGGRRWGGRGFNNPRRFMRHRSWHSPPPYFGLRSFYRPVYTVPIYNTPVTTQIREVVEPSNKLQQVLGGYCGKSSNNQKTVCETGMICNIDNRCVTYAEHLDTPGNKNREFRVCNGSDDRNCLPRNLI